VKMRFDEVNEKGGIYGRKIKLIVEDTQYQVPRAVQAGAKLINRDRIFAMVAGLGTPMNNALFKDQIEAGVPNLFPLSAARSMFEPFNRLKFYGAATYVDQVRAGINYFVTKKGKKSVCAMYQDTDFGKEVMDGIQMQVDKMKIKLAETTTHKRPTRTSPRRSPSSRRRAAISWWWAPSCAIRSCPTPPRARSAGPTWTSSAPPRATTWWWRPPGRRDRRVLCHGPHRHAVSRHLEARPPRPGFDRYKDRYKIEPNIGAVYGHVAADLTVVALEKAGKDLTLDSFVKALESIKSYKDIFNGPEASFGPDKHQGANSSFLAVVKGGRWVRVTDPLSF